MKLKKFLKAANGRICGGTEYQWECFPNGQYTDVSDLDGNEVGGCIYNRLSMKVYQVEVHVYDDQVSYRWTHPEWKQAYYDEAEARGVDSRTAYDDVDFTDVFEEEDILKLLTEIVHLTYVHSKPLVDSKKPIKNLDPASAWPFNTIEPSKEVKGLNPASAWPFPLMDRPQCSEDEDLDGTDADWGHDEIYDGPCDCQMAYDDVDECNMESAEAARGCCGDGCCGVERVVPEKEFEVLLTVKHRFSVKARNMEQAIDKAKLFEKDMKSGVWPKGLCWEDRWVSKTAVSRRLETTNIEE